MREVLLSLGVLAIAVAGCEKREDSVAPPSAVVADPPARALEPPSEAAAEQPERTSPCVEQLRKHAAEFDGRCVAIRKELATLVEPTTASGQHRAPWAGEYRTALGRDSGMVFMLAPEAGFVWKIEGNPRDGRPEVLQGNFGAVKSAGSADVVVEPALMAGTGGCGKMANRWSVIGWDARSYLVPEDQLLRFVWQCNRGGASFEGLRGFAFKSHRIPQDQIDGAIPRGVPELPASAAGLVSLQPVHLTLQAFESPEIRDIGDGAVEMTGVAVFRNLGGAPIAVGTEWPYCEGAHCGVLKVIQTDGSTVKARLGMTCTADTWHQILQIGTEIRFPGFSGR